MIAGDTIKAARAKKGLTYKKLSETSGLSISYISDIENNRKPIPMTDKFKIILAMLGLEFRIVEME